MGRKAHSNYVEAARTVLTELGGGPMPSRDLVAAAQERGLLPEGKWTYHNFLRKIRESGEFDTSVRGEVALMGAAAAAPVAPEAEVPAPMPAEQEVEFVNENLGAAVKGNEF